MFICLASKCNYNVGFQQPIELALSDPFFEDYKEAGMIKLDLHFYSDDDMCKLIQSKNIQCIEDVVGMDVKHVTLMDYLEVDSLVTCQFECITPNINTTLIFYCSFKKTSEGYILHRKHVGEKGG